MIGSKLLQCSSMNGLVLSQRTSADSNGNQFVALSMNEHISILGSKKKVFVSLLKVIKNGQLDLEVKCWIMMLF